MPLATTIAFAVGLVFFVVCFEYSNLQKSLNTLVTLLNTVFISMLVFMVTKDDYDRYGIWKTFIGTKQPSITQMLEFGKWAVFRPVGILMQATIIDFNTEDDTLVSSEQIEISSQYTATNSSSSNMIIPPTAPPPPPAPPPPLYSKMVRKDEDNELKCKRINWKELNINLKNTIWDKVNQDMINRCSVVDAKEVLEIFREKPKKSRKFSGHSPSSGNKEDILTITGKKQLNISIALAHHQLCAADLIDALRNVDVTLLEADFLNTIENFLPDSKEEASLMQKYSTKTLNTEEYALSDPEEFSFLISSVPDFRKRIRAMVFQCSFHDRVNAICKNFEVIKQAVKEIKQSGKLEKILLYILSIGKIINSTSAKAFNIDFLTTASRFKTSDGDSNLLMYIVSKIKSHEPEMLNLSDEMRTLDRAVKVSLNDVDRDCTELAVEYSSLALELDAIAAESESLSEFLREGRLDLNNIKRNRRTLQQELTDLIGYFGVHPSRMKPTEIFDIMKQFLKDIENAAAWLAKKALDRKTSTQSMIRSSSTPNFRKNSRTSSAKGSRNVSLRGSRNSSAKSSRNSSFRNSKSGRSMSVNSNFSDLSTREREISCTDDSGVDFPSISPSMSVNSTNVINMKDRATTKSNDANDDSSFSTISNKGSLRSGLQEENHQNKDFTESKGLETRKKNHKFSFSSQAIDDVLESIKFEEDNAKEKLKKILSPVRECAGKNKKAAEKEGSKKNLSETAEKYDNSVGGEMADDDDDTTKDKEEVRDVIIINKSQANHHLGEERKMEPTDRRRELENNHIQNLNVDLNNDKNLYNVAKNKGSVEIMIGKRGNASSRHSTNINNDVSSESERNIKSSSNNYIMSAEHSSPVVENSQKSSSQKTIKISYLTRKSSLRGSNRKPKKVSIKAMQIKELQKTKKLLLSKSASSLTSKEPTKQQTSSNGVQSFVLKEGFIEKSSPTRFSIEDFGNNINNKHHVIADNNNNNIKCFQHANNNKQQDSSKLDEFQSTKQSTFRRTKSAVLPRNSQIKHVVISNYTIV